MSSMVGRRRPWALHTASAPAKSTSLLMTMNFRPPAVVPLQGAVGGGKAGEVSGGGSVCMASCGVLAEEHVENCCGTKSVIPVMAARQQDTLRNRAKHRRQHEK